MKQPKWRRLYNDTYFTTKMTKNWKTIIADINKNWMDYSLSFCEPDEKEWIKNVEVIYKDFEDVENCMAYAEIFMNWYLYAN